MIPTQALRPGDRTVAEIRGPRNRLLCGAGVTVTEEIIAGLRQHGVRLVHVAPRKVSALDLGGERIAEIEAEVAHRFALVAPDSPLQLLRQACLSVLLGVAQKEQTDGDL